MVLVTAITPTPAGEGKTTVSIGLADGLNLKGVRTMLALREPSLGPVFGVKGGATGGGYAQVIPMDEINLHFTGDLHAIGAANNLLAAMVDNHIFQGNEKKIQRVTWKRCVDMNDRQLRNIQSGLGGSKDGVPREDGFDITAASEVMATLCLSSDLEDLTDRLGRLIVGYDEENHPVTAHDLHAEGAMTALLKEAMQPNLVQTLGGTPALVHGGPFANIAHGCNTVVATKLARKLADVTVTEAGFGADLGAEKFLDIKCRHGARAEIPRRRGQGGFEHPQCGSAESRAVQFAGACGKHVSKICAAHRGCAEPLCFGQRGRTGCCDGFLRTYPGGKSDADRSMGQRRAGRAAAGRGCDAGYGTEKRRSAFPV